MPGVATNTEEPAIVACSALTLITSRHSVSPKRLVAPGPCAEQLQAIVHAAGCAPDHALLRPWRLMRIGPMQRDALADVFEQSLLERVPEAGDVARDQAREKAYRAPELLLAVARLRPAHDNVPDAERHVALGAALQNLLLAAHGLGFAAMLTSGQALRTFRFARAFRLADGEHAVCFVSIGTPTEVKQRRRPAAAELMSDWAG
jgi:nitroreductase